jgi:prefoldin subunit 5
LFSNTSAAGTTPTLFGTPQSQPSAGGLFGAKPAGSLFSTGTTAGGFGGTATGQQGLGGPTALGTSGLQSTANAANNTQQNPLDGEVPQELLNEFEALKKKMKHNKELAEEFAIVSSDDSARIEERITKALCYLQDQKTALQRAREKITAIANTVTMDNRMAEQVHRRYEMMSKNPQYGRDHAVHYMKTMVDQYEGSIMEYKQTLSRVDQIMASMLDEVLSNNVQRFTQRDLYGHLQRFDDIFRAVAQQVHDVNDQVQELKEIFVEQRKKVYGRFVPNPFQKRKDTLENVDAFSSLKGVDAFPSQTALMSLSEYLPKTAQLASTSTFGQGGSLFAPKPATTSSFLFNTGGTVGAAAPSLFSKTFSTTVTTASSILPTTTTTPSLFSTPASSATAASTNFGNTLNSSASGTLFGGSAIKTPLFGK